ncbi:BREX-2 system phosphatase PglZ [Nocardiopsis alba]|uniref:BREX-2 system phosphatase PglZ n=1 Tax=Nocardiopsis alba TaxID=53437 RepID=UPI0035D5F1C6
MSTTVAHGTGRLRSTAALGRVNAEAVANALERALDAEQRRVEKGHPPSEARALALSADPYWEGPDTLPLSIDNSDGTELEVIVRVVAADSVLAVVHALSGLGDGVDHLVVLTPLEASDLGETLLGSFLGEEVMRLNNWELLRSELKVTRIDPRLYSGTWSWLADTLRSIRATHPLKLGTGVLKLEQALSIAVSVRFGRDPGEQVDSAALLEWTRNPASVASFTHLPDAESERLRSALEEELGAVPQVLFKLLDRGHALDAIPIGLALAELADAAAQDTSGAGTEATRAAHALIRAQERYFGANQPTSDHLKEFASACTAALLRMLDGTDDDHTDETVRRTEELLFQLDAAHVAQASGLLDAGLHTRLADLGRQITLALGEDTVEGLPRPQDVREAETALVRVREHRRHGARAKQEQGQAATDAVRLLRRLALATADAPLGADTPTTARGWLQTHVHQTGWVDRAASAIWHHRSDVPAFAQALDVLYRRVRWWRADVDAAFAVALNRWNSGHGPSDTLLRAENLQRQIVFPLAGEAEEPAPLIVVLDGMSVEVAVQLAEDINAGGRLTEIVRTTGRGRAGVREGALATVPSTTNCSRTSLLTGRLTSGKQGLERAGFAELWGGPEFGGRKAVLYHQRDLEVGAGFHLPDTVQKDIDTADKVVGVVLNTIDDALSRGRESDAATWQVRQVGKLGSLLDAAARAGRPVVLTSDHGHVWDRGDAVKTQPGESARYRTGEPGDGELLATGDRVLEGDNALVVPYREDIRYTDRKEGYHGGFSAAEMVIPVLVFVPALDSGRRRAGRSDDQVPDGWQRLDVPDREPVWWTQALEGTKESSPASGLMQDRSALPSVQGEGKSAPRARRKQAVSEQTPALFGEDAVAPRSLGAKTIDSPVFAASQARVPKAPDPERIAALIDALEAVGGTHPRLPVSAASRASDGPESHPRAVRHLKMVGKVLNVEAYPVLTLTDGDRSVELNTVLLRQQFPQEG